MSYASTSWWYDDATGTKESSEFREVVRKVCRSIHITSQLKTTVNILTFLFRFHNASETIWLLSATLSPHSVKRLNFRETTFGFYNSTRQLTTEKKKEEFFSVSRVPGEQCSYFIMYGRTFNIDTYALPPGIPLLLFFAFFTNDHYF